MTLPSSVHWKKEAGSEAVNEKVASLLAVLSGGPSVMAVSGRLSVEAKSGPQNVPEVDVAEPCELRPVRGRGQSTWSGRVTRVGLTSGLLTAMFCELAMICQKGPPGPLAGSKDQVGAAVSKPSETAGTELMETWSIPTPRKP